MYVEQAIKQVTNPDTPVRVLDLCAAPGGKSTHLLSLLPEGSLVVSNEVISSRNKVLQQNISKWGYDNVIVTQNEVEDFRRLKNFFDIILVDAPCSGEGLFRKQASAVEEWSVDNVNHCSVRQASILDSIYDSLKEDGHLIYCTCTFETSENEEQVERMMETYKMELIDLSKTETGIKKTRAGLRFYPHLVKGEGFFISLLKKTEPSETQSKLRRKQIASEKSFDVKKFLEERKQYFIYKKENELYAFPQEHVEDIFLIMENLFVRMAGIHLCTIKGKDLIPAQELAWSNYKNKAIESFEFNEEEALSYLRCGNPTIKGLNKGFYLATFKGQALGWFKEVGGRINNYFPKEYRILKS
jgi:NOL1/NOP2/fmu family ribosome biogenesis protein/23S rRNA U2552 (ribose-2'-O)-methylase RlmE/FtsJ